MTGRDVCYHHGGRTPRGVASPHFKHGRYSKHLPKGLQENYNTALSDPELKELTADLALIETRIIQLLEQVEQGGGFTGVRAIKANAEHFKTATNDTAKLAALGVLLRTIDRVYAYFDTWDDIINLLERRRRVVDTEARRQKELNLIVTIPQLEVTVQALVEIIKSRIQDQKLLSAISQDIQALFSEPVPN
jgi:hypothetical protein